MWLLKHIKVSENPSAVNVLNNYDMLKTVNYFYIEIPS